MAKAHRHRDCFGRVSRPLPTDVAALAHYARSWTLQRTTRVWNWEAKQSGRHLVLAVTICCSDSSWRASAGERNSSLQGSADREQTARQAVAASPDGWRAWFRWPAAEWMDVIDLLFAIARGFRADVGGRRTEQKICEGADQLDRSAHIIA